MTLALRVPGLLAVLILTAAISPAWADYRNHPRAGALVSELEREHGLDPAWVRARLAEAESRPHIIETMRKPAERVLRWHEYRQIFLDQPRIDAGAAFLREHADIVSRVEREYGVPGPVIASIIGVETRYGGFIGRDRVLDALATLGFDYPPRADFFRRELGEFLVLAREEDIDIDTALGSYAGAMGMPQFIPSSYRYYAVDGDGDGRRDLWNSPADIIASVANYLAEHGWQRDGRVALPGRTEGGDLSGLTRSKRKTRYEYRDLTAAGLRVAVDPPADDTAVGLVELAGNHGPEFWVGLHNFFVITTYNHSRLYAMAVSQLADAISAACSRQAPSA